MLFRSRLKRKTMRKNVVVQRMKEDTRGEDLRVLYVALTRAKEKLILTGYVNDFDKKLANNVHLTMESAAKLPYSVLMGANSYMDMILAALIRHNCMRALLEERGFEYIRCPLPYREIPIEITLYQETESQAEKIRTQLKKQGKSIALEEELSKASVYSDAALKTVLDEKLHYVYPHADLEGLTVKTTVSELKKTSYEEAFSESAELVVLPREHYIPSFALEDTENIIEVPETEDIPAGTSHAKKALSGIQYGTAVHKIMELLSFSEKLDTDNKRLYAILKSEQEQWIAEGTVTAEELACVGINRIKNFFQSNLAKRMIAANARNRLFKEQPFVLGIGADQLKPGFPSTEIVLIQGVIDVFFYENEEIVLADYKTDKVSTKEELIARYKNQLDYYQQALEQITGKRVKERYLYSFSLQEEIYV